MATRCNIIVKGKSCDKNVKAIIYRHWDGYPSCTGVELQDLLNKQSADYINFDLFVNGLIIHESKSYEYSSSIHGDIEYLYTIDLTKRKIYVQTVGYDWEKSVQIFHKKQELEKALKSFEKEVK